MKRGKQKNSGADLFFESRKKQIEKTSPLSVRMRPRSLDEVVGQQHILGKGTLLSRAIAADRISSLILYGPPGTGKTSLAHCISCQTQAVFERLNAVAANVDDLRQIIAGAQNRRFATERKTIVFIDEIHRFNKAQQDVLMPDVECGNLILIGATTFNPFFSLVSALLSRSMVFELFPLDKEDVSVLIERALHDRERGLGGLPIEADPAALDFLAEVSDGDARRALNALEIGCLTTPKQRDGKIHFTIDAAQESIQKKRVNYDRDGDQHYDTISAFIKSMRGSDPDAAIYWLAKMIYAGEDPRFIARRIAICAAEDVGNADPQALVLAMNTFQSVEMLGLPEARIPLAQAAAYVACAPKSNSAITAIDSALADVKTHKTQEVPAHLKDSHYSGAKKMGHGKGYQYAHSFDDHYVEQEYMPYQAEYYVPSDQGYERKIRERMERLKKKL
ncbi:MAG: replication-associated recombination protein A [Candidatus Omnitrophota bacterium]